MAKRVMLAVAGAGKTHYICHSIQPGKKNLILAYTHENIHNIKHELIKAHGSMPELTNVMTFDSFVYRYLLCPYEPTILKFFGYEGFIRRGITTKEPPPQRIEKNGKIFANPRYFSKDNFRHYITHNGQYYCANISELIMLVKENQKTLIKKAAAFINCFYDHVLIDEFQDFREYDYELIVALAKETTNILMVGDYYQHSVSATNNTGKPFKKRTGEVSFQEFKQMLEGLRFEIDETTLKGSRRCPKEVCEFVKSKLKIDIEANNDRDGQIIWLEDNVEAILEDSKITKLVFQNARTYSFNAVNWSYSKGDTMDNVCVILTEKFNKLKFDNFTLTGIPLATINKIYVAMTRTKGNLYFIGYSTFKAVKEKYNK